MNLKKICKNRLKRYLTKVNNSFFSKGYDEQKKVLDDFEKPKDLIERSVYQYKCQMHKYPFFLKLIQNIMSLFLLTYYFSKLNSEWDEDGIETEEKK